MFLVLGIDAATWSIINPNLHRLVNLNKLLRVGKGSSLILKEKPISASIWCGMFSGKKFEEHKHEKFVVDGHIMRREDIPVEFIWDIGNIGGKNVKALNVPFIVPPYSFNVDFKPVGFGLPTNEKEWYEELERVTETTEKLIAEKTDLLISVYTLLDRIQHFHWGEDYVVDWYERLDAKLGKLIFDSNFMKENNKLIVISDHGFCSFGDARIQTLPMETDQGKLKGDHHEEAVLLTYNVNYEIEQPQDVFYAIKKEMR